VVDSTQLSTEQIQIHFGLQENNNCVSNTDNIQDANIKLCIINLMQNLFANLLPSPSLKNIAVQDIISQEKVNLV
jgi:hypothetical protein